MRLLNGLLWVALPKATVGLVVRNGVVVDAPPYARKWTLGRDVMTVISRIQKNGTTIKWIADAQGDAPARYT